MPVKLDEWADQDTVDTPDSASVLVFGDCGAVGASLCQLSEGTLYTSTLWCEYSDETENVDIVSSMDEVVRSTTAVRRQPEERRSDLPLRAYLETMGGLDHESDLPLGLYLKTVGDLDYERNRASVVALHPWKPTIDQETPEAVDLALPVAIDFALRNLVDVDTGERTTLSTLVRDFLGKPQKGRDYFSAKDLGAVASRAGKALFDEIDPAIAEQTFDTIFDLGFHLHRDPDGAPYWSLVRDGVNVSAVVCRNSNANRLFACLVPMHPEPLLLCTSLLSADIRRPVRGELAIVHLSKRIAHLQDEAEERPRPCQLVPQNATAPCPYQKELYRPPKLTPAETEKVLGDLQCSSAHWNLLLEGLHAHGHTLRDLPTLTEGELLGYRGIGWANLRKIRDALWFVGRDLAKDKD